MEQKLKKLREIIAGYGKLAVAFSGGVDSALLMAVAHEMLGDNALAITANSALYPERETREAVEFCENRGIRQVVFESDVLDLDEVASNPPNRCYLCKTHLLMTIIDRAREEGFEIVAEGSNIDDGMDYRPGSQAVKELGVRSPLAEAGLAKADIRAISKQLGLPTWNKQSFACLASRFVYGDRITSENLAMVDAAEQLLIDEGFKQLRVRSHGNVARIELAPDDIDRMLDPALRARIVEGVKDAGFAYVSLDLQGYRTGAMNETL